MPQVYETGSAANFSVGSISLGHHRMHVVQILVTSLWATSLSLDAALILSN